MSGLNRYTTRATRGSMPMSNSIHLPTREGTKFVKPVKLPPGRAKLCTTPAATIGHVSKHDGDRFDGHMGRDGDGRRVAEDHVPLPLQQLVRQSPIQLRGPAPQR